MLSLDGAPFHKNKTVSSKGLHKRCRIGKAAGRAKVGRKLGHIQFPKVRNQTKGKNQNAIYNRTSFFSDWHMEVVHFILFYFFQWILPWTKTDMPRSSNTMRQSNKNTSIFFSRKVPKSLSPQLEDHSTTPPLLPLCQRSFMCALASRLIRLNYL